MNQIAFDETVIRINGQQYWLSTAVDPETGEYYHVKLYATRTIVLTAQFLRELRDCYDSTTPSFSSTVQTISKLHSGDSGSYFGKNSVEIETL